MGITNNLIPWYNRITKPIILAGMNVAAGPELAAAVSNYGGLGVIGGVGYTPKMLREQISELKAGLASPDLPFGVDLVRVFASSSLVYFSRYIYDPCLHWHSCSRKSAKVRGRLTTITPKVFVC